MKRFALLFVSAIIVLTLCLPVQGQAQALEQENSSSSTWLPLAPMPTTRGYVATDVLDGKIYVVGGNTGSLRSITTFEVYDPLTNKWSALAPLPAPRNSPMAAGVNGKLYVFGGLHTVNGVFTAMDSVFCYDPLTNAWTTLRNMPAPRFSSGTVVHNGLVYLIGGGFAEANKVGTNTMLIYDPLNDSWSSGPAMPTARIYLGAAIWDNKIYAIGGHTGHSLTTVEEYSFSNNTWRAVRSLPAGRWDIHSATRAFDGKIYVVSGCFGATICERTNSVVAYRVADDTWETQPSLPVVRSSLGTAVVDGKLYAAGGYLSNKLDVLDLSPQAKPWTWMFYVAADQESEDGDLQPILPFEFEVFKKASTNPTVNIVALVDSRDTDTRYMTFTPNLVTTINKGELSTGDPKTLTDFIQWAQKTYPAQHYALIIMDHGHGHTGVAWDGDAPGDSTECKGLKRCLTLKELRQALSATQKIDIVNMVACTMGTIEAEYQLRGLADFYVSSQESMIVIARASWWANGNTERGIPPLSDVTTPEQLAVVMAQSYFLEMSTPPPDNGYIAGTISVARLSNIEDLVTKTNALATELKNQMASIHGRLSQISQDVQRFDSNADWGHTLKDEIVDLYDFANLVQVQLSDYPLITNAAGQVKASIESYIVSSPTYQLNWSGSFTYNNIEHDWQLGNSHGVSIFFPNYSRSFYKESWLDFAAGTTWDINQLKMQSSNATIEWGPMLVEYVRQTNPTTPDDPNPPDLIAPLMLLNNFTYLPQVWR